jgi:hypothetical protein
LGRAQPAKGFSHPAKKFFKDDIMKSEYPAKIARLLAVMRSVAEKKHGLVVEEASKDTKLRKVQEAPPQPPQQENTNLNHYWMPKDKHAGKDALHARHIHRSRGPPSPPDSVRVLSYVVLHSSWDSLA